MSEFGYHAVGVGGFDNVADNVIWVKCVAGGGSPTTPASSGTLTTIWLHGRAKVGTPTVEAAIYSDSAGAPSARLAQSAGTVSVTTLGWYSVTMPSQAIVAGTQYWLALRVTNYGGATNDVELEFDTNGSLTELYFQNLGAFPNPQSGATSAANERWSIYADYTPTAADSEKPTVRAPGLQLGTPGARLHALQAKDQVGQLSALGLSITVGMADLQPAAASSTEQRPYKPPGIGLGTPASKLRGVKASDQIGQLSALGLSITVGQADLQNSTIPGTSPSFNNPELDLGSPLSKLRAKYATDQMGQLSALALSFTVGMADLQGLVTTQSTDQRGYVEPGLGLGTPRSKLRSPSATDQQGQLSALGVSVTVGSAELTGSGALSGLGLSMTVGSGDLVNDPGAMQALGLSMTVGSAELSYTFTAVSTERPAGRRTRHIYRVTVDGNRFEFKSYFDAIAFLDKTKTVAETIARQSIRKSLESKQVQLPKFEHPKITVSSRDLRGAVTETKRAIAGIYEAALRDAEIGMWLMEIESKKTEEEAVFWLLM